jgi:hypothetical protein
MTGFRSIAPAIHSNTTIRGISTSTPATSKPDDASNPGFVAVEPRDRIPLPQMH